MKFTKILSLALLNLSLFWLFSITVMACSCYSALPCESYSRAGQVFIGKLQKLEKIEKSNIAEVNAYFVVERMFKGSFKKEIIVKFETICRSQPFIVGETYFVYDDSGQMNNMCNRTNIFYKNFSKNNLDLKYAESLFADKPQFLVLGRISELPESELKKTFIEIEDGELTYKIHPARYGFFEFLTYKQSSYNVKITVPFLAEVFPGDLGLIPNFTTSKLNNQTSVEYKTSFQPNACNYVEFNLSKNDSKLSVDSMIANDQK